MNNVGKRLGSLNTSTPENFVGRFVVELSSSRDALVLENMVHEKLEDCRIVTSSGNDTEFFRCPVDVAIGTVKRIAKKLHFPLVEFKRFNYEGRCAATILANQEKKEKAKAEGLF